jgi:hypothetical protein
LITKKKEALGASCGYLHWCQGTKSLAYQRREYPDNMRNKPLLAVRYKSQVYTAILSEQLSREEKELKREKSLNTQGEPHVRVVLHVICLQFLQLRNTLDTCASIQHFGVINHLSIGVSFMLY